MGSSAGLRQPRALWRQAPDGRVEHRFEPAMLVLALLIIPVVLVEESNSGSSLKTAASVANWAIWAGFLVELVFVVTVAPRKLRAVRAHWFEVLIVVVSPPFLAGVFSAFRAARLLRLLRVVRLGLLGGRAIRAERAIASGEGFRYIALFTAFLVAVSGAVISDVDSRDFPNVGTGMWWAITTVTTVGYGDYTPHTTAGRIVGAGLMLVGIGFLSLLTATIASSFVARSRRDAGESVTLDHVMATLRRIEARLDLLERPTD